MIERIQTLIDGKNNNYIIFNIWKFIPFTVRIGNYPNLNFPSALSLPNYSKGILSSSNLIPAICKANLIGSALP